jgi:hypothetical protein
MSTQTETINTGQQATINTDRSKIFLFGNTTNKGLYNNSGYNDITIPAGTVLGRVASTGYLIPLKSNASDGSQFPVGIMYDDMTIQGGTTEEIYFCVSGDVAEEKVILQTTDTLETTVSSRRLRDRLAADTVGIRLVSSTEMTAFDN